MAIGSYTTRRFQVAAAGRLRLCREAFNDYPASCRRALCNKITIAALAVQRQKIIACVFKEGGQILNGKLHRSRRSYCLGQTRGPIPCKTGNKQSPLIVKRPAFFNEIGEKWIVCAADWACGRSVLLHNRQRLSIRQAPQAFLAD